MLLTKNILKHYITNVLKGWKKVGKDWKKVKKR